MSEDPISFHLGPYHVRGNIGKGGMGEVLLAYDPVCGRQIALKRIRTDFETNSPLRDRFLKEARITSQLSHPSIIPIYNIHPEENGDVYYTMPFVEGKTLKQLFRDARKREKEGLKADDIGATIPAMARIFLNLCQAIAYAHSNGVLHRDIKPENIILGKYGQVVILDWGLAKVIGETDDESPEMDASPQLTNVGKIVGTIAYMAPERAKGNPATIQTDIYSLGVILYQILTLRYPFIRGTIKEFRQTMHKEFLHEPSEVAPYRDVPRLLSVVVKRALSARPEERYASVDELIHDIENYIEGRSEWFEVGKIDIENKKDWEFQENVLIAENVAITRGTDLTDWVVLMISKASFGEQIRIETRVRIGEQGHGIGFLLNVPEESERNHPNDGFCVWLASDKDKNTKVVRSTVEVMQAPDVFLKAGIWYMVRIEMIERNIYCYINNSLQFSYISHLPLAGTHVGLLTRDSDFTLTPLTISLGGQSAEVSCLAIPDAFLAHKDYTTALTEYRRIGYAFAGRAEGRDAMFRAGVTLLEQARLSKDSLIREALYEEALNEFGKLHKTPGAPLEYLGKGLVYQSLHDYEEESKCYELALRRYPKHPLLPVLHEQVLYRMHESSRYHAKATYHFILLAFLLLPDIVTNKQAERLIKNLKAFWEPLPFFAQDPADETAINFTIQVAFWLAKSHVLIEILNRENLSETATGNAIWALIKLGATQPASEHNADPLTAAKDFDTLFSLFPKMLTTKETRCLFHLMDAAPPNEIESIAQRLENYSLSETDQLQLNLRRIQAFLWNREWEKAGELLQLYPVELLIQETTLLHFLYGCFLLVSEGKEISDIHFASVLQVSFPRSWTLAAHYINGDIHDNHGWFKKAFMWDRRQLYQQLALYYHCLGNESKVQEMKEKERLEFLPKDPFK